ncbi:MAG: HAD-IIB family hydrolase [Gammaproteobacteria bacterium]
MTDKQPLVVITDLDGTLLDHDTYQYDAAIPALQELTSRHIPLILNSSKTAAEMKLLRDRLGNQHPFVVENGAGIYLPKGDDYKKVSFGMDRQAILSVIHQLRSKGQASFTGFADFTIDDIMQKTGLDREQARLASERDFTEPVLWKGEPEKLEIFKQALAEHGMTAVQGGRFISISGKVDKGQALRWLRDYYQEQYQQMPVIVALGDSDNDRPMLENADYAIVVRSPVHEPPLVNNKNVRVTESVGPRGWNDSLLSLLHEIT